MHYLIYTHFNTPVNYIKEKLCTLYPDSQILYETKREGLTACTQW